MDEFIKYFTVLDKSWPWIIAIFGGLVLFWKSLSVRYRAYNFMLNLHKDAEDKSIDIISIIRQLAQAQSECDIRHRLSENKLHTAIFVCNIEGQCTYSNDYLCELFGLSYEEMLDTGWLSVILEEDRIRTYDKWIECVKKKIPYSTTYTIQNNRTKQIYHVKANAWCISDLCGTPICYLGSVEIIK